MELSRVSYAELSTCDMASMVLSIGPCVFIRAATASSPRSSHMVPINSCPNVYRSCSSSTPIRAAITCCIAFPDDSAPPSNLSDISSALNPSFSRASAAVPSFQRILYSLTASPNLSMLHVPASAPFASIFIMSSAENPAFLNCTEYSLMVSSMSPF